ncbi:uncharacterized protein PAN0_019c5806 [Moesziomyces antarcticus]|uniref:80 kDa nuclear cap binding protein n=2 Tax=Pseudozyma antarctica TaxID=84753 RepID=A0A081CLN2_PSEA2|nr:uncharacterized protein PAN0_019c5806 [Moesziomyces antarcticus]GAK67578.1 conserved hypothetical protein [Moesziomyces antarcticus]
MSGVADRWLSPVEGLSPEFRVFNAKKGAFGRAESAHIPPTNPSFLTLFHHHFLSTIMDGWDTPADYSQPPPPPQTNAAAGWANSPRRGGGRGGGHRGGGGGGHYHNNNNNYHQQQQQYQQQSDEQRIENRIRYIRSHLFKLGEDNDFHPPSDLLKMARWINDKANDGLDPITAAFRVMVTEQPHKIPLIAALIGFLCLQPNADPARSRQHPAHDGHDDANTPLEDNHATAEPAQSIGLLIVNDLIKAFRSYLDARLWRNTRLSLHLFAALVPLHIVPAHSLRALLTAFAAVLDEPAVAAPRADRAAMCIIQTLCRAGHDLLADGDHARAELDQLVQRVVAYDAARKVEVQLTQPVHDVEAIWLEGFPQAVQALEELRARDYARPAFLPVPADLLPAAISPSATAVPEAQRSVLLPDVLVPPEEDAEEHSLDVAYAQLGEHQVKRRKVDTGKGELEEKKAAVGPERISLEPRWFAATVPALASPAAVVLRAVVADMMDLYEVNRKEAARLLLDLPNWLRRGTFTGKISPEAGLFGELDDKPQESGWSLDDLLVESILSTALVLPSPPRNPLYYTALLREIVSLTPGSVAPSLGRTIRTFYNALAQPEMDVEAVQRFADWFAIHLSNFNFGWAWKEWIADTALESNSAKVVFIRRIVELEVRLAYYDRIKQTLPAEIAQLAMADEEPGAVFTYAGAEHPYHAAATALLSSIRAKASADVILADFESFKASIISQMPEDGMVGSMEEAEVVVRDLVVQCVLQVGSRSFSHLLNIVERYHGLLRTLSRSARMRAAMLAAAVRFWIRSPQWLHIVVDKLLQYRIVEPADVVEFIFNPPRDEPASILTAGVSEVGSWAGFNTWGLLKLTLDKVNGRVDQLRRRLEQSQRLEAEELERQEAAAAAGFEQEDAKAEPGMPLFPTTATLPVRPEEKAPSADDARASLDAIRTEQRKVLLTVVQGFLALKAEGWNKWWVDGWYTAFVRTFNRQLLDNKQTVLAICFEHGHDEKKDILLRAIDMLAE